MSTAGDNTDTGAVQGAKARAEETVQRAKADAEARVERFKADAERAKNTASEMGKEISTAVDDRRGGPATSVADAEAKAAHLRAGIERDLAALQARIPDTEDLTDRARSMAVTVGGSLAAVAGLAVLIGRRRAATAKQRDLEAQAEALARVLARAEQLEVSADTPSGGLLRWVLLAAGATGAGAGVWWWQQRREDDLDVEDLWGPEPA